MPRKSHETEKVIPCRGGCGGRFSEVDIARGKMDGVSLTCATCLHILLESSVCFGKSYDPTEAICMKCVDRPICRKLSGARVKSDSSRT